MPISFAFPFGIAYIAGQLLQVGEKVVYMEWPSAPCHYHRYAKELLAKKPLLIGFSGLYPNLTEVKGIVLALRTLDDSVPILIGGQMVSPTPEFALDITGADLGVIGEGELIVADVVKALRSGNDPLQTPGLVGRLNGEIVNTGMGDFIKDLKDLPPIPYELIPMKCWLNIGKFYASRPQPHWKYRDRVISIHGGRGCPYRCNFCYHHSHARYRPIEAMVADIKRLVPLYQANMVYFGDDLVLSSPKRALELVTALKELPFSIEYSVSTRFDILARMDDELLMEMKRMGCRIIGLGIESGSQRILDLMGKNISITQIREGLRRLKNVNILPTVSIQIGQVSETHDDVAASKQLLIESIQENPLIVYAFTITTAFPGSPLYKQALASGAIKGDRDFNDRFSHGQELGDVTVNLSQMSDEDIRGYFREFQHVYEFEKRKALGEGISRIEQWRTCLYNLDSRYFRNWLTEIPVRLLRQSLIQAYEWAYDMIQERLDKKRFLLMEKLGNH